MKYLNCENFKEIRIGSSITDLASIPPFKINVNFDKVYKNMVKLDLTEDMNIRLWFHSQYSF